MDNRPIGIFDSGLGGLTVWKEIARALPDESLVYFGDGKNCPYGSRTPEEIRQFSTEAIEFLLGKACKLIVVACNTATAAAIDYLRSRYSIPLVGMEPAVKPAALASQSGVIGIVATEGSLHGELFRAASSKYADKVRILPAVGEGFVELVESNREETPEAVAVVRKAIEPLLEEGADQIVLGCTHYPFLTKAFRQVIGTRKVALINPAPAIARRVEFLLSQNELHAEPGRQATRTFHTAASQDYLDKLIAKSEQAKQMDC